MARKSKAHRQQDIPVGNRNLVRNGVGNTPEINPELAMLGEADLALLDRAISLHKAGRHKQSARAYAKLLDKHPRLAFAQYCVGLLFDDMNAGDNAYKHLRNAVSLAPDQPLYWSRLSMCLGKRKELEAAVIAAARAVALAPSDVKCQLQLGEAYRALDDAGNALVAFEQVVHLDPENPRGYLKVGLALADGGDFEKAESYYLEALKRNPGYIEAHYQLLRNRSAAFDWEAARKYARRIIRKKSNHPRQRASAHFTQGLIAERNKDYDIAFENYAAGNALVFAEVGYDNDAMKRKVDDLIAGFTPETFERLREAGSDSDQPVFIVGMPRSGTTLTEQILASHPKVHGVGEVRKMALIAKALYDVKDQALSYPLTIADADPKALGGLADDYLAAIRAKSPEGMARITDKLPGNAFNLGLIAVLFPKATIIHCVRNPLDTCLSCFFQMFAEDIAYSCNLTALGTQYRQYERMMAHWKTVLPNPILDVVYEEDGCGSGKCKP